MQAFKVFWGDLHDNPYQTDTPPVPPRKTMEYARSHLDFYAPAYYVAQSSHLTAKHGAVVDGNPVRLEVEAWKAPEKLRREWAEMQDLTRAFHEPGRFVTFPCWEWQGNGISGDHNVVYRGEGGEIYQVPTLRELYEKLRGQDVIAIPHHIGYRVRARGKDWAMHDDQLSPFAEIYSVHGCSETDEEWLGLRINSKMGPGAGGGTYQDALDRGYHVGAICSPDGDGGFPGRFGWGVMAVLAPELTRDALWEAFQKRRVYGTTGDRIRLDFRVNDAPMGECISASGPRRIHVRVEGMDAIDRVEVLRDGRVIHTHGHQGAWRPPAGGERARFKFRVEAGWGMYRHEGGPQPTRVWRGRLTLPDGARVLGVTPCWVSDDQTMPDVAGSDVTFAIRAPQIDVRSYPRMPHQNGFVFEIEAAMDDLLRLEMDGLRVAESIASLCAHSRVLCDTETAASRLHTLYDIGPFLEERPGFADMLAHKVKLHRLVPQAGSTCAFDLDDDAPLTGEHHYRVRVEQRNGQRAWSSPIWVSRA